MIIGSFTNYLKLKKLFPRTIEQHLSQLQEILVFSDPITQDTFHQFIISKFDTGVSAATINKYIQTIKNYGRCFEEQWVEEEKQYKVKSKPRPTLSDDEIEQFLLVPRKPRQSEAMYLKWQLFWSIALFCGCRLGEVRTLQVDRIDFGKSILHVDGKTGMRKISLTANLIDPLRSYIQTCEGKYLFPKRHDVSVPMGRRGYKDDFQYRLDFIGIKRPMVPYDMRHTSITRWLKKLKLNIFDVKKQAGHSLTSTTEKYYQYGDQDEITDQLNTLDPLLIKQQDKYQKIQLLQKYIEELKLNVEEFSYIFTEKSITVNVK